MIRSLVPPVNPSSILSSLQHKVLHPLASKRFTLFSIDLTSCRKYVGINANLCLLALNIRIVRLPPTIYDKSVDYCAVV
jgi:hypothetical protein